jgi:hypothetical protein
VTTQHKSSLWHVEEAHVKSYDEELEKETAEVLTGVVGAYDKYLDSMIKLFESMLTPEQLEDVERQLKERDKS